MCATDNRAAVSDSIDDARLNAEFLAWEAASDDAVLNLEAMLSELDVDS